MIRNFVARFTLTIAAVACSTSSPPAGSGPGEANALEQARARAQDLANSTQNYQPVRFVSAIEQVRPPRPVREPKAVDVVKQGTDSINAETISTPMPGPDEAPPVEQVDSSSQVAIAPRVPSIVPREAPAPAAVGGAGEWRGHDPGPDMGTTIGVVLRGGRVDPGHCPRHPRPPSQIPNRIPPR